MSSALYRWMLLVGILGSAWYWHRRARRDSRLFPIYLAALFGGFAGAKLVYLFAEGWIDWHQPDRWIRLATGKTVVGALLGGFLSVEWAKHLLGYRQATGDQFATVVPISIALGRLGCWSAGCCLGEICKPAWYTIQDSSGHPRWPSVPLELGFNLACIPIFAILRLTGTLPGQHFHLYIISYGIFRFGHEFLRATPRWVGPFSGYHIAAALLVGIGVVGFVRRRRALAASPNFQGEDTTASTRALD